MTATGSNETPTGLERRHFLRLTAAAGAAAVAGPALWSLAAQSARAATAGNLQALQQAFVNLRFGMFLHFNMSTFHDVEWCPPNQDPKTFNPTKLDPKQWAAAAKSAGMTFGVLTTKHHDGFALWPSKQSKYNVSSSSIPTTDVVRLFVDAFRAAGLTPCLYFSIWDRTQGIAQGSVSQADIDYTKGQLTELLGGTYGKIQMLIIDGWSWQMGHQEMPYSQIREHIKSLQPDILIIDHNGQTEPWEEDAIYFEEPKGIWCPPGNTFGSVQGQNITSNGWFWHPPGSAKGSTADTTPRSASNIATDHIKVLEPRWCNFLLNCPPNNKGLLDTNIVNRLAEVGPMWKPNTSRAALPAQPDVLLHPVTPVSATATSGVAGNAVDGWIDDAHGAAVQTLWQSSGSLPQSVTLDLGAPYSNIDTLGYLPRQDYDSSGTRYTTGNITGYRVLTSTNGSTFTQVVSGSWAATKSVKWARFTPVTARYVRLEATKANGAGYAIIDEIDVGAIAARPVAGGGTSTPTPTPTPTGSTTPTGYVTIVNRHSGKVLDVTGASKADGAAVIQYTDHTAANQQWQLLDAGSGYVSIVNRASGKVLDITGGSTADGAAVIQYTDHAATNQQWQKVDAGGGYTTLVCRRSGKALDIAGGSTADSAAAVQETRNTSSTSQQWKLTAL